MLDRNPEEIRRELLRKRNEVMGAPAVSGSIRPRVIGTVEEDGGEYPQSFQPQQQVFNPSKYSAYKITEVKKIESSLLKEEIKKWFDFCLSSENSFKDTLYLLNIVGKDTTLEMIFNVVEENALIDVDGKLVSIKTKDVNDVLNQLPTLKNQAASLVMKSMMSGSNAPFIKVSGFSEFMVGRDPESLQLAKRIVNALNFLSLVPDNILDSQDTVAILGVLIEQEKLKHKEGGDNK